MGSQGLFWAQEAGQEKALQTTQGCADVVYELTTYQLDIPECLFVYGQ